MSIQRGLNPQGWRAKAALPVPWLERRFLFSIFAGIRTTPSSVFGRCPRNACWPPLLQFHKAASRRCMCTCLPTSRTSWAASATQAHAGLRSSLREWPRTPKPRPGHVLSGQIGTIVAGGCGALLPGFSGNNGGNTGHTRNQQNRAEDPEPPSPSPSNDRNLAVPTHTASARQHHDEPATQRKGLVSVIKMLLDRADKRNPKQLQKSPS